MTTDQRTDSAVGFRRRVRLESIDPDRNRCRFFVLSWQPTLWDGPALVPTWGRLGRPGRSRVVPVPDGADPRDTIRRVLRRRLRHGYRVTDWHETVARRDTAHGHPRHGRAMVRERVLPTHAPFGIVDTTRGEGPVRWRRPPGDTACRARVVRRSR